jgi:hypothetical protein
LNPQASAHVSHLLSQQSGGSAGSSDTITFVAFYEDEEQEVSVGGEVEPHVMSCAPVQKDDHFIYLPHPSANIDLGGREIEGRVHSNVKEEEIKYPVASALPCLAVPIGKGDVRPFVNLEGLLDTGGCSNLGWLPYFQELARVAPHTVARFFSLKEKQMEDIRIGGIGGHIVITHMIELWMPYILYNKRVKITIGLSNDLPINCILGTPFTIMAQLVYDAHAKTVHSKLLGVDWIVEMKKPSRKDVENILENARRAWNPNRSGPPLRQE